jgi:photosystem II stability/assembly factor-like uncharacterized protein
VLEDGSGHIASFSLGELKRSPVNPDLVYSAAGAQGVVASRNGGETWRVINPPLAITSDIVALPDNILVVVGTNEEGQALILRTADDGGRWETVHTIPIVLKKKKLQIIPDPPVSSTLVTLAQHPTRPDVIYAGSNSGTIFKGERSARVWTNYGSLQQGVAKIIPSPHQAEKLLLINGRGQLYQSQSSGSFEAVPLTAGLPDSGTILPLHGYLTDAVYMANNPGIIFIAGKNGVAVSRDDGLSWQELPLPIERAQKFNNALIGASPSNIDRLFVGINNVLYRSEDGGITWNIFNTNLSGFMIVDINFDPRNAARMLMIMAPIRV